LENCQLTGLTKSALRLLTAPVEDVKRVANFQSEHVNCVVCLVSGQHGLLEIRQEESMHLKDRTILSIEVSDVGDSPRSLM